MKKIALYTLVFSSMFLGSCSSDDSVDTEKPVIVLEEPGNDDGFKPGTEMHVEGIMTDNDGLASYKIEIHSAEDGHSHNHARTVDNYFHYEETFTLADNPKVYNFHHHIAIPSIQNGMPLTPGHYHLGIFALDKSGNQAQVFVEIYIGDDAEGHHHH